ncbi:hypothetical protein BaRGS_00029630 [Batillaria attramentaria]|uniref:Uncharacterized protein n=1 Tax=Batillaria attramentaria TaxID=370345 RepID=A0ABD0JVU6_9CAEN
MLQRPGDGQQRLPAKATLERRALTSTSFETKGGWRMRSKANRDYGLGLSCAPARKIRDGTTPTQGTKYWSNSQDKHTCKRHKQHNTGSTYSRLRCSGTLFTGNKKGKNRRVVTKCIW